MIPMATISVISYMNSQTSLEKRAFDQLQTLADDRAISIKQYTEARTGQLNTLAQDPVVVQGTKFLTEKGDLNTVGTDQFAKYNPDFASMLEGITTATGGEENGFHNFKIISNDGRILYSDKHSEIGTDYSENPVFIKGASKIGRASCRERV